MRKFLGFVLSAVALTATLPAEDVSPDMSYGGKVDPYGHTIRLSDLSACT